MSFCAARVANQHNRQKEPGLLYWGRSRISLGPEKKEDDKDGQDGRGRGGKGKAKSGI
jgi:hypothetical protein